MKKLLLTIILLIPFFILGQTTEDVQYYESGEVKSKVKLLDGKRQGEYIEFYVSGEVESKANYVDDKVQGEFIAYYESGAWN